MTTECKLPECVVTGFAPVASAKPRRREPSAPEPASAPASAPDGDEELAGYLAEYDKAVVAKASAEAAIDFYGGLMKKRMALLKRRAKQSAG